MNAAPNPQDFVKQSTFTLEKLAANGGREIREFYQAHPSDNIHMRKEDAYAVAAEDDAITVLRTFKGVICAAAVAYRHNGRYREIGSVLNTVEGGFSLMEVLIAFQVAEWAMSNENTILVADIHTDNKESRDLFERLGFEEWQSPDKDFIALKKKTIEEAAPERPVVYYKYNPERLHTMFNYINFGAEKIHRHAANGQRITVNTTRHPCSSMSGDALHFRRAS